MDATHVMEDNTRFLEGWPLKESLIPSLFDNAIFGFALYDKDLRYLYINHTLAEMNGLPVSDHIGRSFHEVLPNLAKVFAPFYALALETGRPLRRTEVSGEMLADSGCTRDWVIDVVPMRDSTGESAAIAVTVFEVTQLKQTQAEHNRLDQERIRLAAEVVRQEDQLESILRNIPAVVWEASGKPDEAGQRIEYVSEYAEMLLGYRVEEWLSTPTFWLTIVAPEDKAIVAEQAARAFALGENSRAEFRWLHKDGHRVWVEAQTTVIKDDQGQPIGLRGVNIDITERKLLEAQLRQAQKMEAIGLLAGGIAHDFNNMLTVVSGYSDLALAKLRSDDPARRDIEGIKNSGSRAAALTRQLLIFSRKQVTQPVVIDLNTAIRETQKMLHHLIGENIQLVTTLQPDLGSIRVDRGQVEQVIMNLVVNSRDALPRGGTVRIETANVSLEGEKFNDHDDRRSGAYVMMAVTDNGVGMDAETRSRVFEPFFTTKEPGKGTGLGLSTVYGIVHQAKGTVSVSSEPGHGTTFKIYFPSLHAEGQKPLAVSESAPMQGTGTILLTEDDDAVRAVTCAMLEKLGYRVLVAANAEEALVIAENERRPIDLLLTDVVLPKADGVGLCRLLVERRPNLKVLYMSGYTDNALLHQGLLDGSVCLIPKPFDAASLGAKVRDMMAKPRG